MRVLLLGATGTIGARLQTALVAAGHQVVGVVRRAPREAVPGCSWRELDVARLSRADWREQLDGIDAVVNTIGIFREPRGSAGFDTLHHTLPSMLFAACVEAGVPHAVHFSALGADPQAPTEFLRSKGRGDAQVLALPLHALVLRPSLVFAPEGASSQALLALAALPLQPRPAGGRQPVQPVHVDDAVAAVLAWVGSANPTPRPQCIELVGPHPLALRDYLEALRRAMGLGAAPGFDIPSAWVALMARVGDRLRASLLDTPAWTMLSRGSTASPDDTVALLKRPPRPVERFIEPQSAALLRLRARLAGLAPLLRAAVALLWIATAIVSFGLYPREQSFALLARAGVAAPWQPFMLYAAAALDLLLGALSLMPSALVRWRQWVWPAQMVLIVCYSAVIAVRLPEFWLHPYGPMTKNLPLLALLALLTCLDRDAARQNGGR